MNGLFSAEFLKLRKRLMPRILLLILLASTALVFFGSAKNGDRQSIHDLILPNGWLLGLSFASVFAPFIAPILAGSWAGSEYSWGTIRLVLSRRPNRAQFLLAGISVLLSAVGIALLATLLLSTVSSWLAAVLLGRHAFNSAAFTGAFLGTLIKLFFSVWLVLAFYIVLAFSAGTLFRSGAVGIGVGVGLTLADLILTGIFYGLGGTWRSVADHFPDVYARALPTRVAEGTLTSVSSRGGGLPTVPEAVLALAIYILVPLGLALVLVRYRDVTA
jgi:ABC-type transport system involved in multi-copper enzyme maturation permease subunit